jgi:predicted short-subunit dehydrogenase-like oxidoreductase (DUF2520 family)
LSAHIHSISFVGAGNVATHLAQAFYASGYTISGIYSQGKASSSELSAKVNSKICFTIHELLLQTDLVIICVPDHEIADVLEALVPSDALVVHTSGGTDLTVFKEKLTNYGVIYPLQTFSKTTLLSLRDVPFCIEASDREKLEELRLLCTSVSDKVMEINSYQRKILHLSAVFACNFSNSMYAIAADLLMKADLPFELLHPLILETARKATTHPPSEVQTGPARRSDIATMKTHEAMLKTSELYREIYILLSKTIQAQSDETQ